VWKKGKGRDVKMSLSPDKIRTTQQIGIDFVNRTRENKFIKNIKGFEKELKKVQSELWIPTEVVAAAVRELRERMQREIDAEQGELEVIDNIIDEVFRGLEEKRR